MAIKAQGSVTVYDFNDIKKVVTWYKLVLRTSSAPTVAANATEAQVISDGWGKTEPGVDTTKKLYTVQQNVFGDDTYVWGDVSLSSSYEAAIQAYNKAASAESTANTTAEYFWFDTVGDGAHITKIPRADFEADPSSGGGNTVIDSDGLSVNDGDIELAHFGSGGAFINKADDGVLTRCFTILPSSTVTHNKTTEDFGRITINNLHPAGTYTPGTKSHSKNFTLNTLPSKVTINVYFTSSYGSSKFSSSLYFDKGTDTYKTSSSETGPSFIKITYDGEKAFNIYYEAPVGWSLTGYFSYYVSSTLPAYDLGYRKEGSVVGGHSTIIGEDLIGSGQDQIVVGKYNSIDYGSQFIVGTGSDDDNRRNALTVNNQLTRVIDLSASGYVHANALGMTAHSGNIGEWDTDSKTVSVPHNTSSYTTGLTITLSEGVWIVIGQVTFASNSTGRRAIKWAASGDISHTLAVQPAVSGTTTRMQTVMIAAPSSASVEYKLMAAHNAGSGTTLPTDFSARWVRII